MKLRVFHHNGQLAEFPLEFVHSIEVHGHDAAEKANKALRDLLRKTPTQVVREVAAPVTAAAAVPEPAPADLEPEAVPAAEPASDA